LVDGTAYALSQGLSAAQVRDLARAIHAPYDAATTLRVAATLSGLGVPPKQTVQLVEGVLQAGGTPDDVLDLPSEVEAGMAPGARPAPAAQGLGHDDTHGRPPAWGPAGPPQDHNARAEPPAGDYTQLRLVVDQATITLVPGVTFRDGSSSQALKVPSGAQSGIKVNFAGPLHIEPGATNLVVDFDVSQSFVFRGDPSHPNGV